jgi:hypothetical protein
VIIRFFQRWAFVFAILTGSIVYHIVLPDDSPRWLEVGVMLPVAVVVYMLLHKNGVTTNRPPKRPKGTLSR